LGIGDRELQNCPLAIQARVLTLPTAVPGSY
jgi:hypothetical protein